MMAGTVYGFGDLSRPVQSSEMVYLWFFSTILSKA